MRRHIKTFLGYLLTITLIFSDLPIFSFAEDNTEYVEKTESDTETIVEPATSENASIEGEIISERTENTKTFRMTDGSYMLAEYPIAIHEMSESEQWQEIDNSLDESNTSTYSLVRRQTTLTNDDYPICWEYRNADMSDSEVYENNEEISGDDEWLVVQNLYNTVLYNDIYEDIDLKVISGNDTVKEDLILNSKETAHTFVVDYYVDGLQPIEENNIITLVNEENECVYTLTAPLMYDAAGEISEGVQISLSDIQEDKFTVTVTADNTWLQDENRAYPVVVDPVITTEQNSTDVQSRYYVSGTYDAAHGTLFVGLQKGGLERVSSALKFSLPTLEPSDIILNAQLHLAQRDYSHAGISSNVIDVHAITTSWSASTSVPGVVGNPPSYNSLICDYYRVSESTSLGFVSWDITDTAKKWYDGSLANNGLLIKAHDETIWALTRFYSPQSVTFTSTVRPIITIQYVNGKGMNAYHDYTNVAQGYNNNIAVNNYNGNLVYNYAFNVDSGNRTELDISLTYNSEDYAVANVFAGVSGHRQVYYGKGFRANFAQNLASKTISGKHYYIHTDGDGTKTYFEPVIENGSTVKWRDEYNQGTELHITDSTSITITYENGYKLVFSRPYGYLSKIIDNNGNTFTLTYDTSSMAPNYITDSLGRKILFTYDNNGYLKSITDVNGKTTTLNYSNGYLVSITDTNQRTVSHTYDSTGRLATVNNPQSLQHVITYTQKTNKPPKVQTVSEKSGTLSGNTFTFTYGNGSTTITDTHGNKETSIFDYLGRTINKFDKEGNIISAKYNSDHQTTESQSEKYVDSHILDGTVTGQTYWWQSRWGYDTEPTMSLDSSVNYMGSSSLKICSSIVSDNFYGWGNTANRMEVGKTYTLSAYVKTSGIVGIHGAILAIGMRNSNQEVIMALKSNGVKGDSEWQRLSLTFTVPYDAVLSDIRVHCGIDRASGTAWFDNVQLEEGAVANRFNYLSNGSFDLFSGHKPYMWDCSMITTASGHSGYCTVSDRGNRNGVGLIVKGYNNVPAVVPQFVDVSLNEGQVVSVSGWIKSMGIPLDSPGASQRYAGMNIAYNYTKNGNTYRYTVPFNFSDETTEWQYFKKNIVILGKTSQLEIALLFNYNSNYAIFDDFQLFVGESGNSYEYNDNGTLKTSYEGKKATSYSYDTNRNLTKITYPDGTEETMTYDLQKRVTSATDITGTLYSYTYDSYGNVLTMKVGSGANQMIVENTYSSDGNRLETVKDSNGKLHRYNYNSVTNLLEDYTDPNGNKTTYTYTMDNRLYTVSCGSANVTYDYDVYNLTSITTGGKIYTFESDDFYDSTERIKIGSLTLIEHLYATNNGRLEKSTYGDGTYVENVYQSEIDNTVIGKSINGVVTENYLLDAGNSVGVIQDNMSGNTITYEYDELGRIYKQSDSQFSHEVTYSYDEYNRLQNRTSMVSVVNNKYAELTGVTMRKNLTTAMLNDKNQLTSSGYGYGNIYYVYDSIGRVLNTYVLDNFSPNIQMFPTSYTYVTRDDGYSTSQVQSYTVGNQTYGYTYDNNGNILSISRDGMIIGTYTYDALNQLTSETRDGKVYTYSYDSNGNLQNIKENGNLIQSYGYSDVNWPDKLTSLNGNEITYDDIGNPMTYYDGKTFTWQNGRQLSTVLDEENTYTYTYDRNGIRISKKINEATTEYVWSDGKLIEERLPNGSLLGFHYDATDTAIGFDYFDYVTNNFNFYYYMRNLQGDIVAIVDRSGNIIVEYSYDAWGNILSITGEKAESIGLLNPFRYRGYYYDAETGFYYVSSRYYDPEIGRFLNADGQIANVGGDILGYNMFAYCMNNPVNMSDPTGNWPKWATKLAVAVAVVATVAVVAAVTVATAGAGTAIAAVAVGAAKGAAIGLAVGATTGAVSGAISHRVSTGSWKGAGEAALNGMGNGALTGAIGGAITGGLTGGLNNSVCFVAGTSILTAIGHIAIEDIVVGDEVWAEDPETGEKELKKVVQTFVNETDELVHVYVNDEEIITTPEHPFYTPTKGWVSAIRLRAGDILLLQSGKYVIVEKVQHEILESPMIVYNFEVEDFHTYYVSDSAILVHNTCGAKSTSNQIIKNDIINLPRTGSALKNDAYHAFSNIVDNYAGYATKSSISNGTLYQLPGSLNGVAGRFEWIVQNHSVTHRMFVKGGTINGIPIMP